MMKAKITEPDKIQFFFEYNSLQENVSLNCSRLKFLPRKATHWGQEKDYCAPTL